MKECPDRDLLERLLDNRLAGTELDELDRHVRDCASCQQTLETLTDDSLWKSELPQELTLVLGDAEPARVVDRPGLTNEAAGLDRMARAVPAVPGYEISGELGRGGMGVVYQARHVRLNRPCALKMVLAGAHASPEHVARFITEAESIARLEHPSIVQIRHIGDALGLPFLELEFLPGGSLERQLDGTPWPTARAARLAEQVALGIAEAHRQGIVHRDLKPSNVFLAADGTPKVGDFGLAKMLDSQAVLTQSESVMGSPSYMAPEQAEGHAKEAGPSVDIYALGAILYELLTGRPPFRGTTALETLEQVKGTEPVPPSRLVPGVPRDIETICLKCLRKEPGKRYETAQALSDDLRRFLDGLPILARRTSGLERAWRWCRRNRLVAGMTGIAAAAIISLAVGATAAAFVFRGQRDQIRQAGRQIQENLLDSLTAQARATRFSRQVGQRFESLIALKRAAGIARELKLPPEKLDRIRDQAIASFALPDLEPTGQVLELPTGMLMFCFDSGMSRYALRLHSGAILVRRVADDQEVARFQARGDRDIGVFCFSPDGRYLATTDHPGLALTVWDVDRNTTAVTEPGPVGGTAARFSPDSRRLALARRDEDDVLIYELEKTASPRRLRVGLGGVHDLAFRPDGLQIAVTNRDGKQSLCRILELESSRVLRTILLRSVSTVAWGQGGATLATAGADLKIDLWDAPSGIHRGELEGSSNGGLQAAFHPVAKLLASNGWEGRLRIWDAVLGQAVLSLTGNVSTAPVFSADGRIVLASEGRSTTYLADPALEYRALIHVSSAPMRYQRVSIRHDNRLLAVGSNRGVVLWDLKTGTECAFLPIGPHWQVLFEDSGDLLTGGETGVQRWPVQLDSERREFRIGPPRDMYFLGKFGQITDDRAGRIIAAARPFHAEVQISGRSTRVGPLDDCRSVAVSPDGEWLATGSHHLGAIVWRIRDSEKAAELPVNTGTAVAFSPDGRWLLSSGSPCKLWTTDTWALERELGGVGLCFSPEGRLVALLDANKVIRLVEAKTGRVIARLESPDTSTVNWATFSPDGSHLVLVPDNYPAVHVWDLRAIRKQLAAMGLDWDAPALSDDKPAAYPLPPFQLDLGPLAAEIEHVTTSPATLVERYTTRLKNNPSDVESYHHRGHALYHLQRVREAIDDLSVAVGLRPDDPHLRGALAESCNNRAWNLATGPRSVREPQRAVELARRAVELVPNEPSYENTLGVALYHARHYTEAIQTLERNLVASLGELDGFDLFYLSMAHHRQGRREQARACFDRAVRWVEGQKLVALNWVRELAELRVEAEAVLAGPAGELPDDVFGPVIEQPAAKRR